MADIVVVGQSIEGLVIDGCSRKPLSYKGLLRFHDIPCHRFISEFNVRAQVVESIANVNDQLDRKAKSNSNDQLLCDIAVIHSKKNKYSHGVGSNISATHGASLWHFPNQTNVQITRSHESIENAIRKNQIK